MSAKIWGNQLLVNGGLFSRSPVELVQKDQNIYADKSGSLSVAKRLVGDYLKTGEAVIFTSERYADVLYWTRGVEAALSITK